jgi:drug/metabolite transporter (DMT)-like permease
MAFLGACTVFVITGPLVIKLNAFILKNKEHPFEYPIALSALGVGFTALVSRTLLSFGVVTWSRPDLRDSQRFFRTQALPLGAVGCATLALGNSSYMHLSVAMCQILKAFTPAITVFLLFVTRVETPKPSEVGCVALITLGTIFSVSGKLELSQLGLALQLGANFAEAFRIVLSQKLLANMKLPLLELQYHVAPVQLGCLLLTSAYVELNTPEDRAMALAAVWAQPLTFAAAAALGLGVQAAGLLAVKIAG